MDMPIDEPTAAVKMDGDRARSACCNAELRVTREVHDTVVYTPEGYDPVTSTLNVRYTKVYEGEADGFYVTCTECDTEIDCEVEEL